MVRSAHWPTLGVILAPLRWCWCIYIYIYIILAPINGLKYIGNWGEMTLKTFGHGYIGGYSVKLATRPHEFELCRIHGGIREPILLYLFWFGGLCGKCIYIFIYIYIDGVYGCIWGSFEKETAFWGVATFSLWKIPFLECVIYTAGGAGPIPSVSFMGTWTTDSKPLKAGKKEKSEQEGLQGTMMADTWRASKHPSRLCGEARSRTSTVDCHPTTWL